MSKKILIISSSPRKGGNSDSLCDSFQCGAEEAGNFVKKIALREKKIACCTGCGACALSHKCVQQDDMDAIVDEMIAADIIVLATPVYFYTMCAQLKTMIDRMNARYTEVVNKAFYFILTAETTDAQKMERTADGLRGFLACLKGAEEMGILYAPGLGKAGAARSSPAFQKAYEMGKRIH